ncbi:hypothetical protein P280DRAFT_178651 [Massarina eburnea CBS 473.64]|uniref:Uncharacterized protein n=1 Tax=Massarina eburnea CBS 473.64 TaxID=1395130 RepID=A0A6A6SC10_9PLEO|nr:hypothetical protein P280DRAFT_178651 [Massarina eburnea CBS 473.64]
MRNLQTPIRMATQDDAAPLHCSENSVDGKRKQRDVEGDDETVAIAPTWNGGDSKRIKTTPSDEQSEISEGWLLARYETSSIGSASPQHDEDHVESDEESPSSASVMPMDHVTMSSTESYTPQHDAGLAQPGGTLSYPAGATSPAEVTDASSASTSSHSPQANVYHRSPPSSLCSVSNHKLLSPAGPLLTHQTTSDSRISRNVSFPNIISPSSDDSLDPCQNSGWPPYPTYGTTKKPNPIDADIVFSTEEELHDYALWRNIRYHGKLAGKQFSQIRDALEYDAFVRSRTANHVDDDTPSSTVTAPRLDQLVTAGLCKHLLHPVYYSQVKHAEQGTRPLRCAVCNVQAHLDFLAVIRKTWNFYMPRWTPQRTYLTKQEYGHCYGRCRRAYHDAKISFANHATFIECWAREEAAMERMRPGIDMSQVKPHCARQAVQMMQAGVVVPSGPDVRGGYAEETEDEMSDEASEVEEGEIFDSEEKVEIPDSEEDEDDNLEES